MNHLIARMSEKLRNDTIVLLVSPIGCSAHRNACDLFGDGGIDLKSLSTACPVLDVAVHAPEYAQPAYLGVIRGA